MALRELQGVEELERRVGKIALGEGKASLFKNAVRKRMRLTQTGQNFNATGGAALYEAKDFQNSEKQAAGTGGHGGQNVS